jgi:hypothetical protein
MKFCYQDGTPINRTTLFNPFEKYYDKVKDEFKPNGSSRNPRLLDNYILLIAGMFEEKCLDLEEKMRKMDQMDPMLRSQFAKYRRAVYSRLNELESLRKTMVRAQQIHQSQVNKLQKENYKIRSNVKSNAGADVVETSESRERGIILERNMRAITFAKRSSKEITRTLAIKNIDPTKEKLEEALEDFVLFSEMIRDKHAAFVEKGVCEL